MNERKTIFSPCSKYRYTLWREWDCDLLTGCSDDSTHSHEFVQFIGLNPSTADETLDDPTIRRCIGFAKSWGYGAMCMTNLFAFRATDPKDMMAESSPIGSDNKRHLIEIAQFAGIVIAAWGTKGTHGLQDGKVLGWLQEAGKPVHCIRKTATGFPEHPLYLPKRLTPTPFLF